MASVIHIECPFFLKTESMPEDLINSAFNNNSQAFTDKMQNASTLLPKLGRLYTSHDKIKASKLRLRRDL